LDNLLGHQLTLAKPWQTASIPQYFEGVAAAVTSSDVKTEFFPQPIASWQKVIFYQ